MTRYLGLAAVAWVVGALCLSASTASASVDGFCSTALKRFAYNSEVNVLWSRRVNASNFTAASGPLNMQGVEARHLKAHVKNVLASATAYYLCFVERKSAGWEILDVCEATEDGKTLNVPFAVKCAASSFRKR